jgi:hypothetical protein
MRLHLNKLFRNEMNAKLCPVLRKSIVKIIKDHTSDKKTTEYSVDASL